jgi:RNA polymerase sigma factor (sigma-70 family)
MTCGPQGAVLGSFRTLFGVGVVGGMTDGQLLEQALSRRAEEAEAAFAALVAIHGPMVWDVCRGILADPHAAEDAFQATFLVLVRRAASIRRRDAVGPWLHGVARRIALRARALAARRRLREGQEKAMTATSDPDPIRREDLEALHQEVDRLAEKYRAPLVLCYFEGRTHAEAARLLRCPVGTVSVRLSRARDLLRSRLTRRGVVVPAVIAAATLGRAATASAMPAGLADSTIRAATHVAVGGAMTAGVVPAVVARLAGGELKTMVMTKLTWVAAGLLATGSASVGIGLLAADRAPGPPGPAPAPAVAPVPAPAPANPPAQTPANPNAANRKTKAEVVNDIKMIGLAMHNFASPRDGTFPPPAIYKGGKPLLSWRVAILPYLDQQALYDKFHLDEPWDSPHNKALLDQMPEIYSPASNPGTPGHDTHYQVFTGPGTLFGNDEGTKIADVKDGTAWTILVAQAKKPVPWTKPEDLPFDAEKPLPEVGGLLEGGFFVGFADGSARFIKLPVDPKILKALITANSGEKVSGEDF